VRVPGGHEIQALAGKADDFRLDARAISGDYIARIPDGGLAADGFECEAYHSCEGAFDRRWRSALDFT
jgi:hypothetical protein